MFHKATNIKLIGGYCLEVVFDTGKRGVVDLSDLPGEGGVFSPLSDPEYFRKVYVHTELGVLTWPNGADIAPETIYSLATGKPLPEWVESDDE
ncbi:MAG: DUF2442 domain-containing protein [Candidatus Latescibacterota bacterium]